MAPEKSLKIRIYSGGVSWHRSAILGVRDGTRRYRSELVALVINFLCEASQMSILGSNEWVQSALCQQAMPEARNILSEYKIVRQDLKFQLIRQAGPVVEGSWGCRVRERLGNAAAITACASG